MNPARRREMVDLEHPSLPIVGQYATLRFRLALYITSQPCQVLDR